MSTPAWRSSASCDVLTERRGVSLPPRALAPLRNRGRKADVRARFGEGSCRTATGAGPVSTKRPEHERKVRAGSRQEPNSRGVS